MRKLRDWLEAWAWYVLSGRQPVPAALSLLFFVFAFQHWITHTDSDPYTAGMADFALAVILLMSSRD